MDTLRQSSTLLGPHDTGREGNERDERNRTRQPRELDVWITQGDCD